MSATTLAVPIRVDTAGVHARPGLGRLVAVELRKMVNTRAGFWLLIAMVALTAVVVIARRVFGDGGDHTFAGVLDVGLQPAAVLLPITGILLVTSEWSQRTGMITFTLVPARSRVLAAKLLASLILALATLVVSVAVVAAGVLVASPGVDGTWSDVDARRHRARALDAAPAPRVRVPAVWEIARGGAPAIALIERLNRRLVVSSSRRRQRARVAVRGGLERGAP